MPTEWMERITSKDEEPLWTAGWIPLEPQEHRTHEHPHQGHGCWADLTPLDGPTPLMPRLLPMMNATRCGFMGSASTP